MLVAENMSKEEMVKEAVEEAKAKAYKEAEEQDTEETVEEAAEEAAEPTEETEGSDCLLYTSFLFLRSGRTQRVCTVQGAACGG